MAPATLIIMGTVLTVLKSFGAIDWHWALVTSPLWLPAVWCVVVAFAAEVSKGE